MKKISLIVPDLSGNNMVRTYPMAKVLERYFRVEVIGPMFGGKVFEPYKNEFEYKAYDIAANRRGQSQAAKLMRYFRFVDESVTGDAVYAFKPKLLSLGAALRTARNKKLPLALDIEDWEAEPFYSASFASKFKYLFSLNRVENPLYDRYLEKKIKKADRVIVVSEFLKKRFGGEKIVHGADTRIFDPARLDATELRASLGLVGKKVVLFAGVARPHKGLQDLIGAMRETGDSSLKLLLVGEYNKYVEELKRLAGSLMLHIGSQPHEKMMLFLKMADLVALPQRRTALAEAQVPGKVFEAMAMAKPIVATVVSDLREILEGCGWLVEPENSASLASALKEMIADPEKARKMGERARARCIERYSWDAMEKSLLSVFASLC